MSDEIPNVTVRVHGQGLNALIGDPEQRRLLKATPVKVTATWPDHEFKITAPLWMLHVFSKMVREYDAQTLGVEYDPGHSAYKIVPDA